MKLNTKFTTNLLSIDENHVEDVGYKSVILHKLLKTNILLPNSFIVKTNAFDEFLYQNKLTSIIGELIKDTKLSPKELSSRITNLIDSKDIPHSVKEDIIDSYRIISSPANDSIVELEASYSNELIDESNYSEKPIKVNNIKGDDHIISAIKEIWKSLFTEKAINYRRAVRFNGELTIAVVIQKMINADTSGIAFSFNPIDESENIIQIESNYGFSENYTGEHQIGDIYKIDKRNLQILEKYISEQKYMFVRAKDRFQKVNVSTPWQNKQKLDNNSINHISFIIKTITQITNSNIFFRWSKEAGKIYIVDLLVKRKTPNQVNLIEKVDIEIEQIEIAPEIPIVEEIPVVIPTQNIKAENNSEDIIEIKNVNTAFETFIFLDKEYRFDTSVDSITGLITYSDLDITSTYASKAETKPVIYSASKDENENNLRSLRSLRTVENYRNIWLSVRDILDEDQLIDYKKTLTKVKLKRSSTFKLFVEINNLSILFSLDEILSNSIDGIIFDIFSIGKSLFNKDILNIKSHPSLIKTIELAGKSIKKHKVKAYAKTYFENDILNSIIKNSFSGVISMPEEFNTIKRFIADKEISALSAKRK